MQITFARKGLEYDSRKSQLPEAKSKTHSPQQVQQQQQEL